ncbi:MAG: hypothetical protein MR209_06965 [Veillonellaceae bacterium]|nr:hypothetical protein [Veillonellaceae bacterium]
MMADWSGFLIWSRALMRVQLRIAVAGGLFLWLIGQQGHIGGWLLGSGFNWVYQGFLVLVVRRRMHTEDTDVLRHKVVNLFTARLFFAAVFLMVVLRLQLFSFAACVIGFLSFQLVLLFVAGTNDFKHIN